MGHKVRGEGWLLVGGVGNYFFVSGLFLLCRAGGGWHTSCGWSQLTSRVDAKPHVVTFNANKRPLPRRFLFCVVPWESLVPGVSLMQLLAAFKDSINELQRGRYSGNWQFAFFGSKGDLEWHQVFGKFWHFVGVLCVRVRVQCACDVVFPKYRVRVSVCSVYVVVHGCIGSTPVSVWPDRSVNANFKLRVATKSITFRFLFSGGVPVHQSLVSDEVTVRNSLARCKTSSGGI